MLPPPPPPHPWLILSVLLAHEIHICILSHCFWPFTAMGTLAWSNESIGEGMWHCLAEGWDMVEKVLTCFFKDFLLNSCRCGVKGGIESVRGGFQGGWWWLKKVAGPWLCPSDKVKKLWKAPNPGTGSQNLKQRSQRWVSEGARRKSTWWPQGPHFRWPEGNRGVGGLLLLVNIDT